MRARSRQTRKRGLFLVVVGPDGAGKTTLARTLLQQAGLKRGAYFHFIPPLRGSLEDAPPTSGRVVDKSSEPGSRLLGWLRLCRNLVRAWLAYLVTIRREVGSGSLVVGDRWLYGYIGQPIALKFYGPSWLARLGLRVAPKADLVALLAAPPSTIHARKQELSEEEIEIELERWGSLDQPTLRLDATLTPGGIAAAVMAHVHPRMSLVRYPPRLGHILLPDESSEAALVGSTLYAPSRRHAVAAHRLSRWIIGAVGARWLPPASSVTPFDAETWASLVQAMRSEGLCVDAVAISTRRQSTREDAAVLVIDRGRPSAFVRVGSPGALDRECLALSMLAEARPAAFVFPQLLGRGSIVGFDYAIHSIVIDGAHRPARGPAMAAVVTEVQEALRSLPKPAGMPAHWRPMHGDLAPWNLRESAASGPILIDWESAGWGPPGADLTLYSAACDALGLRTTPRYGDHEAATFWLERMEPPADARDSRLSARLRRSLRAFAG